MALNKVLCAVAVTILLAPNGCLSRKGECGLGGADLEPDKVSWYAHISWKHGEKTGSLINYQWVMTSGKSSSEHEMDIEGMIVSMGQVTTAVAVSFEVSRTVESMECLTDVCLIKLQEPVILSKSISPVCLPHAGSHISKDMHFVAWAEASSKLEDVPLVPCKCLSSDIKEGKICAGKEPKKGTLEDCKKNDGGGLITEVNSWWIQMGIEKVDQDQGCPPAGHLKAFNDLSVHQEWIMNVTGMVEDNFTLIAAEPEAGNSPWNSMCPEPTMPPKFETIKPHYQPYYSEEAYWKYDKDSVFTSGVNVMHSSPFVLFCVLALSLYGTFW